MATTAASRVGLSKQHLGLARIDESPSGCIEVANELLQKNHDEYHMYFRDLAGHNHIAHSVLSVLAMGGGPEELKRAYDDGEGIQRPLPPLDLAVVDTLGDPDHFRARMNQLPEYTNFLCFFEREIDAKGWREVVGEYCFSRTPLAEYMLAQLYEGLFHPILHLGFGVEFEQPSLVAEGLAHAASHDPGDIDIFFQRSEELARSGSVSPRPLVELYHEVHSNEKIRTASRLSDGAFRVRDGVLGRAMDEVVALAAQFQVPADERGIRRATAEIISCAAHCAGAAHKPGKVRKLDFFTMHNVTSSLSVDALARQPWIGAADKVRLLEWKARLDLVWYASCAAAELRLDEYIVGYEPTLSRGMDWRSMYKAIGGHHDDGHVAKFVRALKNGQDVARPFEEEEGQGAASFPVKGDLWFRVAQIAYDTTADEDTIQVENKWVWGAGFDPMWARFPDVKPA
ncbi:Oxidoreductase AflY [Cytospora mali]|uniref:Oxidoreductase AflY n=1 Tax=Cytospora mali TaxID=578113 RepID=A0A194VKL6_CYTMA|nr:Oxidoreductase AflY [Valsa mali]